MRLAKQAKCPCWFGGWAKCTLACTRRHTRTSAPATNHSTLTLSPCRPHPQSLCLQIALRMAVEAHTVHGAAGAALQQAVLRQMGAVQRSYQAAAAAAAAAGVVDE